MSNTVYQIQQQPFVTRQDVVHVFILITIAFVFCWVPTRGFGQPTLGSATDTFSTLDSVPPPFLALDSAPAQTSLTSAGPEVALPGAERLAAEQFSVQHRVPQPEVPAPMSGTVSPVTGTQFPSAQSQPYQPPLRQQRTPQREVAVSADHPFQQYWGVPNDLQTKIVGKPMTVAELLAGTRSPVVRGQLLRAYWELSGLLAIYHFRCETERLVSGAAERQQDGMMALLQEQRRTAEMEFIKQQWNLAELSKRCKGRPFRESELPIPADFPLYPRYQTYADKIAWSERTQYLGRMIPIQEQLIESKNGTWRAAAGMDVNQRTMAFLDLTKAIIEYNKMIAEYALETIPPNVSHQELVRAVVRQSGGSTPLPQTRTPQMAGGEITLTHHEASMGENPISVPAQPVAQMAYEYQIPMLPDKNAAPKGEFELDSEAFKEQEIVPVSDVMLDF